MENKISAQLDDLNRKISIFQSRNEQLDLEKSNMPESDWTKSYKYWSQWEDIEELMKSKVIMEEKMNDSYSNHAYNGHLYDRNEERLFFSKSENEKLNICQYHYKIGQYLIQEGNIISAIEQFTTVISYYEYCFPDDIGEQHQLDELQISSFLYLSQCFLNVNNHRKAINYADRVIAKDSRNSLAYYYRAKCYRLIDEYEKSHQDFDICLPLLSGKLKDIAEQEYQKLLQQEIQSEFHERQMMLKAFSHSSSTNMYTNNSISTIPLSSEFTDVNRCLTIFDMDRPLEPIPYKLFEK
jgi:tetratricopeptide (TPR) repeat protein